MSLFKSKLKRLLFQIPPPPHFSQGVRHQQVLHTRLRVGNSDLRANLHKRSLSDTPKCHCGEEETTQHYLLDCELYRDAHEELLRDVATVRLEAPSVRDLLHSTNFLQKEANQEIFLAVQHYIKATRRFSSKSWPVQGE